MRKIPQKAAKALARIIWKREGRGDIPTHTDWVDLCSIMSKRPMTRVIAYDWMLRQLHESKELQQSIEGMALREKNRRRKKKKKLTYKPQSKWRSLRYEAFKKYGNKCQCCGASPETGAVLHVDHIKPKSKFPELEYEISNLQILCEDCNLGKSNRDDTDWR